MWRFYIVLLIIVLGTYYVSVMIAYVWPKRSPFGDVKFGLAIIPFFYWIKKSPEEKKKRKKSV